MSRHLFRSQAEISPDFWVDGDAALERRLAPRPKRERVKKAEKGKAALPELLTYPEACERLRCKISFLRNLVAEKEIAVQPVGGKRLIPVDSLLDYLERERERFGT